MLKSLFHVIAGLAFAGASAIAAAGSATAAVVALGWITVPNVTNTSFDPGGGGVGLTSSYTGGLYTGPAGFDLTANVTLESTAIPIGGGKWQYDWTITNNGTGPLVEYLGPKPPNFLQSPPLFGTAGPDRIPGNGDDVGAESESDSMIGGRPVIVRWGGRWNPATGLDADRLAPVPLPASLPLLGGALLLLFGKGRKRATG